VARARLDSLSSSGGDWPHWLGRDLFYRMPDGGHMSRSATISLPWTPGLAAGGGLNALQRRQMFEASLESCRFVSAHWYRGLARGLRRVWAERLETGSADLLGPLPPVAAALFGLPAAAPGRQDLWQDAPGNRSRDEGGIEDPEARDPKARDPEARDSKAGDPEAGDPRAGDAETRDTGARVVRLQEGAR
jgi:hypothetical protein